MRVVDVIPAVCVPVASGIAAAGYGPEGRMLDGVQCRVPVRKTYIPPSASKPGLAAT